MGIYTLHFGVFDAISTFNEGNVTKCLVLQLLGLSAGHNTVEAMKRLDRERLRSADCKFKNITKEAMQQKRKLLLENEEDPDNPSYGAGLF